MMDVITQLIIKLKLFQKIRISGIDSVRDTQERNFKKLVIE